MKLFLKMMLGAILLASADLFGAQQLVFSPTYDNLLMESSVENQSDPNAASNTNYSNSENSVGINHSYSQYYNYVRTISLIYFDLSTVIGKTVTNATLYLYPTMLAGDPAGAAERTDYVVRAIAEGWAPNSVTWNTRPAYFTAIEVKFEVPFTAAVPTTIDVTPIVQNWTNSVWLNAGFRIEDAYYQAWMCNCLDATSFGALGGDATKIPKLIITIEDPEPALPKALTPIINNLLLD